MSHDSPPTPHSSRYANSPARSTRTYTAPPLNVRVTEEVAAALAAVGEKEGTGYSDTVRLVIERGLRASGWSPPTTQEGSTWQKPHP